MRTSMRLEAAAWLLLGLAGACTPAEPSPVADEGSTGTTAALDPSTGTPPPGSSTTGSPDATTTGSPDASTSGSTTTADPDSTDGSTSSGSSSGTTSDGSSSGSEGTTGPDPGLGMISGECGLIDAMELQSPSPFTFVNAIDFGAIGFDYDMLTPGGQQVYDAGNLGGSSLESEVIAFEVLARCDGASLLATEADIQYTDPMGIKTDILVEIDDLVVGVSVTRAVGFPFDAPYTEMQAADLLTGKLEDILASTANVAPRDAWVKQILHVIAYADMHAQSILAAYATLPPEVTADTILVVTVTHGDDAFIY